jgi:alkanesulfonate monooxygenase SsuD/methylene tetrahydromethanopterin reductase-like flavin-dependent oxidoreductase (luciferase family)
LISASAAATASVEFDAFCVPMDEAWDRFNECLRFILKAEPQGRFSFDGQVLELLRTSWSSPRRSSKPHPPIWMAGAARLDRRRSASNYNLLLDQFGDIKLTLRA